MNIFETLTLLLVPAYYAACLCSVIHFRGDLEDLPRIWILLLVLGQFVLPIAGFVVCVRDIHKRGLDRSSRTTWMVLNLLFWPAQLVYFFIHGIKPRPAGGVSAQPPPLPGAVTARRSTAPHWVVTVLCGVGIIAAIALSIILPPPDPALARERRAAEVVRVPGTSGGFSIEIPHASLSTLERQKEDRDLEFTTSGGAWMGVYVFPTRADAGSPYSSTLRNFFRETYAGASLGRDETVQIDGRDWVHFTVNGFFKGTRQRVLVFVHNGAERIFVIHLSYTNDASLEEPRLHRVAESFRFAPKDRSVPASEVR